MKDKRTAKQKKFDREVSRKVNEALFGIKIKSKKRIYVPSEDYYFCKVCKAKFDKKICDECGKTIHCGQPLVLKRAYIIS